MSTRKPQPFLLYVDVRERQLDLLDNSLLRNDVPGVRAREELSELLDSLSKSLRSPIFLTSYTQQLLTLLLPLATHSSSSSSPGNTLSTASSSLSTHLPTMQATVGVQQQATTPSATAPSSSTANLL